MLWSNIWSVLECYLWRMLKWFLRKTTGLCELQRICYGKKPGAARSTAVEKSLMQSRIPEVKEMIVSLDALILQRRLVTNLADALGAPLVVILKAKKINPKVHAAFTASLRTSLEHIWCYRQLMRNVETLRTTPFDSDNVEHERKLLKLWSFLMPGVLLEGRITKQWQHIGFQGDDPKTDFRGMGILGLNNLLFFASQYPQASRHVLSHSHHPVYGYTFAVVGINLTAMAYSLLKDGSAKTYMYNSKYYPIDMALFHRFYCYLFYEFDKLWMESKPQNMMEFSVIFEKFENMIKAELADPASQFRINLEVDTV